MGLSPIQAKMLLDGNAVNLAKQVTKGKPLSAKQVQMLEQIVGESSQQNGQPAFAKNQSELARILDVSRKTIQRWIKHEDAPKTAPNGSLNVSKWREFLSKHDVVESDEDLNQTELKAKQILLQNQMLEHKLAVARQEYVERVEVEKDVGQLIAKAKTVLLAGPASLAPQVVGVSIPEAEKLLREWLHEAMSKLCQDPLGNNPEDTNVQ